MKLRLLLLLGMVCLPVSAQIFNNLLGPVLEVWVRSQTQKVDDLRVVVRGPDSEIAQGKIQQVTITGRNIVYKGIPASQVNLAAAGIYLDTAGILRGGALRLLKPVKADLTLKLTQQDLNQYLDSESFQEQIKNLDVQMGSDPTPVRLVLRQPDARLEAGTLILMATLQVKQGEPLRVQLNTGVEVATPQQLRLVNPRLISEGTAVPIPGLAGLMIKVGSDVEVRRVEIQPAGLTLEGTFLISP